MEEKTNGMAIASLVLSLCGLLLCGPLSVLGLWFGLTARHQIELSGGREGGAGMATAGIWISSITMGLMVLVFLVFLAIGLATGG